VLIGSLVTGVIVSQKVKPENRVLSSSRRAQNKNNEGALVLATGNMHEIKLTPAARMAL